MELTAIDWVLLGGTVLLMVIGLFRGISGELGSLVGLAAGVLAGWLLFGVAQNCAQSLGFGSKSENILKGTTIVIDCVMALVVGGIIRMLVRKFVSFLMGRAIDSMLGVLSGIIKGALIIGVLTGFRIVTVDESGTESGPFVAHSPIIGFIASLSDMYSTNEK